MPTFIAVAYYSDGSGRPSVFITDKYGDLIRFMRVHHYMEMSVYQKDDTGVHLIDGQDILVTAGSMVNTY